MKDFFPESLGQECGCALYMRPRYTQQNTVIEVFGIEGGKKKMRNDWYNRMGETKGLWTLEIGA